MVLEFLFSGIAVSVQWDSSLTFWKLFGTGIRLFYSVLCFAKKWGMVECLFKANSQKSAFHFKLIMMVVANGKKVDYHDLFNGCSYSMRNALISM